MVKTQPLYFAGKHRTYPQCNETVMK